ncbi:MAG TPA: guanylate kinase [Candidatus Dorea gallistercoris]|uniref:Guanylate kinase n=1 Tax=Candidatus Dorea gallistercoris TaxID=2838542 RepID=A0A9D1R8Y1_9FIRM|nr:guanylate kinase [Candidatus Dorea gallistercoris]
MGKIYYIMGKSSSGKDTMYRELQRIFPELRRVVLYTTRPAREGEQDGVEYFFVSEERLEQYRLDRRLIELRTYHTVCGDWKYATVDDGQICLGEADYLMIGTLESYQRMKEYFGAEILVPIYLEVEDGERLGRALERERRQAVPRYDEMCRRFLADKEDFSEENLKKAGIARRYRNQDQSQCLEEIAEGIRYGKL